VTGLAVLAAAAVAAAVLLADPGPRARRRVVRVTAPPVARRTTGRVLPVAGAGVVAFVTAVLTLGVPGAVVVCGSAAALLTVGARRESGHRQARAREVAAQLPRAADLLSACLESGAEPSAALLLVGRELEDPVGPRLQRVAAATRLGAAAEHAWEPCGTDDPVRPLARAFTRSARTGSPLAETLALVADEQRRRNRAAAEAAARSAGVRAVGPLVLCFLPAFVLVGVVPFVLGVVTEVLGDVAG
jgi:Flp pilus assembly protein TadB